MKTVTRATRLSEVRIGGVRPSNPKTPASPGVPERMVRSVQQSLRVEGLDVSAERVRAELERAVTASDDGRG